jgi:signal transduction histidine kinase
MISDRAFSSLSSLGDSAQDFQDVLKDILQNAPAEAASLYDDEQDYDPRHPLAALFPTSLSLDEQQRIYRLIREKVEMMRPANGSKPPALLLDEATLQRTPYRSAILFPLTGAGRLLGALALFSITVNAYEPGLSDRVGAQLRMLGLLLENNYLKTLLEQNLSTAQSILAAARAIAKTPSTQDIVNILHDTLFDAHISSCAMLLFGPVREDAPRGPYEYLEIRGTWSKRLGSGVGIGVRLYLKDNADLQALLEENQVLTFSNADEIRARFDPLIRGFMRAERVRSLVLLMLQSASSKLGVMVIATDKPHEFTPREIYSYQTVAEFLAISALAQILQQQHDRVQQGRAALLDAVTDGVVMVLPHGQGGHVLTVNQRFTRQFEVLESAAQGLALMDLLNQMQIPEGTRQELRGEWLSTPVAATTIKRGEFHMINTQGEPVDMEWYSAPVYQEQHVLGRIYIFHDVTAERTAVRLRAEFLSRVSHELRTPLTSIQGFAEFILEATSDKLPDLAREYTEIILSSAKRLKTIFDEMIQITRADAGKLQLNKEDAHLPDLIIDVGAQMELQYKQRKQQLLLDLDDDLPPVNIDVTKITQVLVNLMTNAIKYSPEGGKISVSTRLVSGIEALPEDAPKDIVLPAILVSISDDGKGLSREEADQVFMPFFRTEEARKNKIEGVGLGLAVTRSIIEVHRGKIWAVPRPRAEGGCFQLTLPTVRG